jgi:phosphoglycerate dehydrogenase-like enzyme
LGATEEQPPPGLLGGELAGHLSFAATAEEARRGIADAQAVFFWDYAAPLLEQAWPYQRRLRWVHAAGVGVEATLFPDMVASPVVVTNSRGVFDRAMAEYALGLMLAFAKGFPRTLQDQSRHVWEHRETEVLAGKHLLVVGAGSIGRAVSRLARANGLHVSAVASRERPGDEDFSRIVASQQLGQVLPEADFVVIVAPLTPATRHLFDREAFTGMKPTARLINLGRGAIVDEAALLAAVEAGRIAGAALDVFAGEPLPPDSPLWSAPNLIVSPHMSGDYWGWERALVDLFLENLRRWLAGQPLLNVVDKQLGYVPGA